tara:strand:+ start:11825 stop:12544 length:720 start_codon:yes stop_codon:yes gene_type:complete
MTLASTNAPPSSLTATSSCDSVFAEFIDQENNQTYGPLIGIGLKGPNNPGIYFEYCGETQRKALLNSDGTPIKILSNVRLVDLDVKRNIGDNNSTKLNVTLSPPSKNIFTLTTTLTSYWSIYAIAAFTALLDEGCLDCPIQLSSFRGTSKYKPMFASIKLGNKVMKDEYLIKLFKDMKQAGEIDKCEEMLADQVNMIRNECNVKLLKDMEQDAKTSKLIIDISNKNKKSLQQEGDDSNF